MATVVSCASGNFSSSSTWALVDSTSLLDSEVGSANTSTSLTASSTFTPGAITVDGVGIKISVRSSNTGTITVELFNSTDATSAASVITNITNLFGGSVGNQSYPKGWAFFKFASPVTLIAGKAYSVRVATSTAVTIALFRDATASNWSRFLRTTTTQSPAAADNLFVMGEHLAGSQNTLTVTMDNTSSATTYGSLSFGQRGTLTYGTTASTNYYLKIGGDVALNWGGTLNIGTNGAGMPSTSTATLELACTSALQFQIIQFSGTFNAVGATKTVQCKLAADLAAAGTSTTMNVSPSGWTTSDSLAIAPTTRTATQGEKVTVSSISGATIGISAAGSAHSGTGSTAAEVGNLTRNVVVKGNSAANTSYLTSSPFSTIYWRYVEFQNWGGSGARATAISPAINGTSFTGSADIQFCSWHDCALAGVTAINFGPNSTNADNITFANNVVFQFQGTAGSTTTGSFMLVTATTGTPTTYAITDNLFINTGGSGTIGVLLNNHQVNFSRNSISGANGDCVRMNSIVGPTGVGTFADNVVHSTGAIGWNVSGAIQGTTISGLSTWRCTTYGLAFSGTAYNSIISNMTNFGNATAGVLLDVRVSNLIFTGCTIDAGTVLTQPVGVALPNTATIHRTIFRSSSFGTSNAHATADFQIQASSICADILCDTCSFNTDPLITGTSNLTLGSSLRFQDTATGSFPHRTFTGIGEIRYSASGGATDAYSCQLRPALAGTKLEGAQVFFETVANETPTISVKVRRSKTATGDAATYNGNLPRMILKADTGNGLASDTVLATASAASDGAYETLSHAIPAGTTIDTSLNIIIDCDGTAGWVSVDDWAVS